MNNKTFFGITVILVTIIVIVQFDQKKHVRAVSNQFHPIIDSTLPSFSLIDAFGTEIEYSFPMETKISALFILPKPCLSCNPNFYFLDKLLKRYNNTFHATWILSTAPDRLKKLSTMPINPYDVYTPADYPAFNQLFKINSIVPQVTLLKGRKVIYSKSGEIGTEDYFKIKSILIGEST